MINFSIIIPHYNIPDLLIRCINSIPIREDIQVIVVDDCSPNANQYLSKYKELSRPYLEYYSTNRGGSAGRARNVGLDHAKGKWLMFLDSDDLLPEDIEYTFQKFKDYQEELILLDFVSVMSNDLTKKSERNPYFHNLLITYLQNKDEAPIRYKYDPMWGKLVKKSLVDKYKIRFDETRWSNDGYFALSVGIYAKQIYVEDKVAYILTEREGSLAGDYCGTLAEMETRLKVSLRMRDLLSKNGISISYSSVKYLDIVLRNKYSRKQRLFFATKFWQYPKYMLHILRNCIH